MSTTDAAVELATAAPAEGFGAGPSELSDILETLGLDPEESGSAEQRTSSAVDKATRSTTGDAPKDKDPAKADAKLTPEQQEAADFAAVRKRVEDRRKEREKGRRERPAPAQAAAAPAGAAKAPEAVPAKADTQPLNAAEKEAASALRSIVTEIAKMAEDDAPVGDQAKGERAKLIKSLEDKIAGIDAKLGDGTEARTKLAAAEAQIKALADRQAVEQLIDTKLDEMSDKLPILSGRRNAVAIIFRNANKYYEIHGKAPSIRMLAERWEQKHTQSETVSDPEKNPAASGKGKEKTTTPRKTVSSSLATPPAARTSPDKRTKDEAERDFYAALGMDPDA